MTMGDALARLASTVAAMPAVKKNAKGHQSTYLDLPGLIAHVTPVLAANGLSVVTEASTDHEGRIGVRALFVAADDVHETPWVWFPPARTPQDVGGHITYGRRYVLSCALGLPEVDTISNTAPPKKAAATKPAEPNVRRLQIAFGEAGIKSREDRIEFAIAAIGRTIGSSKDMTADEIKTVLKALSERTESR